MATMELGTEGHENGTAFLYTVIGLAGLNATIMPVSQTEATITPDPSVTQGYSFTALGSNFDNPQSGVVTDIILNVGDEGATEFQLSGLSLNVGELQEAIEQSDQQTAFEQLAAIFSEIDWQIDFSAETVGSLIFGSGGDDTITLGSGDDQLMLDGGSDQLNAGGGNDLIYAKAFNFVQTDGLTTVTGGDGNDTFCLDYREFQDNDPIDLFSKGQKVDLGALFVTGDTVFKFVDIENLRGSNFADQLTGTNSANKLTGEDGNDKLIGKGGVDTINGGVGDDKMTGGGAADKLTGGKGADDFIYTLPTDSFGNQHDIITDFKHKLDDIDLSKLHPDTQNDKFVFIGDDKFGKHAGELHIIEHDNSGSKNDFTMVEADLDGNGKADIQIELAGLIHLDKDDFML